VAVECGKTELSKLLNLRKIFNEVLVVNTEKVVEMYEYWKTKYFEDVGKLERRNNELQKQLDWLRKTASEDYAKIENELEMKKSEARTLQIKLKQIQKVIAEAWEAMKGEQS
jgi:predicted RNase H-like nuclease (RuvC/YqgF family)